MLRASDLASWHTRCSAPLAVRRLVQQPSSTSTCSIAWQLTRRRHSARPARIASAQRCSRHAACMDQDGPSPQKQCCRLRCCPSSCLSPSAASGCGNISTRERWRPSLTRSLHFPLARPPRQVSQPRPDQAPRASAARWSTYCPRCRPHSAAALRRMDPLQWRRAASVTASSCSWFWTSTIPVCTPQRITAAHSSARTCTGSSCAGQVDTSRGTRCACVTAWRPSCARLTALRSCMSTRWAPSHTLAKCSTSSTRSSCSPGRHSAGRMATSRSSRRSCAT